MIWGNIMGGFGSGRNFGKAALERHFISRIAGGVA